MSCGTPVATTTGVDIYPRAHRGAGMGHGSPDAAVEVVGLFWRDTESFAEMGRAGWTWAMQHLKAARVIGQSTDMYDAVAVVPSWTRLPAASSHSEGQA